jgi:hypothetical protein
MKTRMAISCHQRAWTKRKRMGFPMRSRFSGYWFPCLMKQNSYFPVNEKLPETRFRPQKTVAAGSRDVQSSRLFSDDSSMQEKQTSFKHGLEKFHPRFEKIQSSSVRECGSPGLLG